MRRRDYSQFSKKSESELLNELKNALSRCKVLQFDLALGKVKNQKELRDVKKTIAQIKTLLKGVSQPARS